MTRLKVGLLFGGCSGEHEVSIASARAIARGLTADTNIEKYEVIPFYIQKDGRWQTQTVAADVLTSGRPIQIDRGTSRWQFPPEAGVIDVWFPVLHGPNGEDGTIQGLLQLMQVPFVGSGVLGSALAMDKLAMKTAFAQVGLPQVKYLGLTRSQIQSASDSLLQIYARVETTLGYPCFVKPANLGSSVGISKVRNRAQLVRALDSAATYDRRIIVEAGVVARELECGVLGNAHPQPSVIGEITFQSDFYDYETKYTAGLADLTIPADLPDEIVAQLQDMAIKAFMAIDGAGLARVDFFYVDATREVFINEINTFPGFTATSMYPELWAATGVPFPTLVDRLVQLALERASL